MQKKFYSIGILILLCIFSLGYYGSYKVADMRLKIRNLEESLEKEKSKETKAVRELITDTTKCTIEEYDRNTGNLKEKTTFAADNLVGMNRNELTDFLKKATLPITAMLWWHFLRSMW